MKYHAALLICAVVGAAGLSSTAACSGPDPGSISFAERPSQVTGDSSGTSGTPGGTSGTPGGTSGTPGGTSGTSGTIPDAAAGDPIFGNTPFAYVAPARNANEVTEHTEAVSGKDCVVAGCHLDNNHKWVFAGTVYSAAQNGTPVAKAEVRVVGPDGVAVGSAFTDANGNFWFDKAGATIPSGSKAGVRKEGGKAQHMTMALQSTDKGCTANRGNCHGTAATGRIFAP